MKDESCDVPVHSWSDRKHAISKQKRKRSDTSLHPSVHAIFTYFEKTGKAPNVNLKKADLPLLQPKDVTPKEFLVMLKKDFPRLYAEFGPTESQIRNHQNNRGKNEEAEAAAETKPDQQTKGKSQVLGFGFCDTNIDSPDKESNASSAFVVGEKNMEV